MRVSNPPTPAMHVTALAQAFLTPVPLRHYPSQAPTKILLHFEGLDRQP